MDLNRRDLSLSPAYIHLDEWKSANPDKEILDEQIRLLNGEIEFVFDPANSEYLELLAQLKADTRAMEKVLQEELQKRQLKIWVKGGKINGCRQDYRRMAFLIRPPFLSSKMEKTQENRMQANDNSDNFIIHFDTTSQLQTIRMWRPLERMTPEGRKIFDFRVRLVVLLNLQYRYLQENYGNWRLFSTKIADIIENVIEVQKMINFENLSQRQFV